MAELSSSLYAGKTVWITGASSGIGESLARRLSAAGARLVLTSRNTDKLEQIRESLARPHEHLIEGADLLELEQLEGLAKKVWRMTGGIDILVNNAGVSQRSLSLETLDSVEEHIMSLDFWAPVRLAKSVAAEMTARGSGTIVNITSMTAKIGSPGRSIYTAAKHALLGYMDCLRAELADKQVRVVNVCPGFVKTNISRNALRGDARLFAQLDEEIKSGMPVDEFVEKLLRKLPRKNEIIIAKGLPLLGYWAYKISPALYQKVLEKVYQKHTWQQSSASSEMK